MIPQDTETGGLYVIATPIGNLADISPRARQVLGEVDVIAAEDTRHSRVLLDHLQVRTPMLSLHDHNEEQRVQELLPRMAAGEKVALISDAGTPLMSDPGFRLVRAAGQAGLPVMAVPGPSAILAALSVAGLATDRFLFEGFLPAKQQARRKRLEELGRMPCTTVCFESPRRLQATLQDIVETLGADRECVVARELTKLHETVLRGTAGGLAQAYADSEVLHKGEAVLLIEGAQLVSDERVDLPVDQLLLALAAELPPRQAASIAAELTGLRRNDLYARIQAARPDSVE